MSIEALPSVLLAAIGCQLSTDDRLVLRQVGRSFRYRFDAAVESAYGPGWIDRYSNDDDRMLSNAVGFGKPISDVKQGLSDVDLPQFDDLRCAWTDLRRRRSLLDIRRFRKAATIVSRYQTARLAAIDAERRIGRIDSSMAFQTVGYLRLATVATIVLALLMPVVDGWFGSIRRSAFLADWPVVTVFAWYAVEIPIVVRRLPAFAVGLRRRINVEYLQASRFRKRFDWLVGSILPAAVFVGTILLPLTTVEFRWSSETVPVCPAEMPVWRYNPYRYFRRHPHDLLIGGSDRNYYMSTNEFGRCVSPFDADPFRLPEADPLAFVWFAIILYGFVFVEALTRIRPNLSRRIRLPAIALGIVAVVFGGRADIHIAAGLFFGIAVVPLCNAVNAIMQFAIMTDSVWFASIVGLSTAVPAAAYFVVPLLPIVVIGELSVPIPRIGYVRFVPPSVRSVDTVLSIVQYVCWTIGILAIVHRLAERRGYRCLPLTRWYFWTFLLRLRGYPADRFPFDEPPSVSQTTMPQLMSFCTAISYLRQAYPAVRAVCLRSSSARSWPVALLLHPVSVDNGLFWQIGLSTAILVVDGRDIRLTIIAAVFDCCMVGLFAYVGLQ